MNDRDRNPFDDFDDDFNLDNNDFDLDDDLSTSRARDDDEIPDFGDEPEEPSGPNRTFIIIAALMILLFIVGLGAVLFLATRPPEVTPIQLTSTAIALTNAQVAVLLNQTETQAAIVGLTETAIAQLPPTETPTPTPTVVREPTITPTPTLDPTEQAILVLTEQALAALTATSIAESINLTGTADALANAALTPQETQPVVDGPSVAQTATYIAGVFLTQTAQAGVTVTPGGQGPTPGFGQGTQLPTTGVFDDIVSGGREGLGMVALMAFGLLGVIVISRRLRSGSNGK